MHDLKEEIIKITEQYCKELCNTEQEPLIETLKPLGTKIKNVK